jgi:hypothetical protein
MKLYLFLLSLIFTGSLYAADTLYITNPHAKLSEKPSFGSSGEALPVSSQVKVIHQEGAFYYVEYNKKKISKKLCTGHSCSECNYKR